MKKILLFALVAMIGMPVLAQDEIGADVTKYVINAGFDEDFTWMSDGSTKQPIVKEYPHHRSVVLTAEDGSVYARGTGKRSDGYEPAWNGFIGQLKGWEMVTNKPLHEPYTGDGMEWTYFGCVPYDLGEHAVPIADDGTTFLLFLRRFPRSPVMITRVSSTFVLVGVVRPSISRPLVCLAPSTCWSIGLSTSTPMEHVVRTFPA